MIEPTSEEIWAKVYKARDTLVEQFFSHPDVRLIEIAYARDPANLASSGQIFLQVHLRRQEAVQSLNLPDQIDGVPVRTVIGEYGAETTSGGETKP